jgi:multidrug transporter EmrE-like cation transporter
MNFWIEIIIISLIGTIGNIMFKIGTDGFGQLTFGSFLTKEFYLTALFSKFGWVIFISLIINFTSKILIMSPLSKEKYGLVWSLLTPIGMILSISAGYLLFHENYTIKELLGMSLGIISVWLMGENSF